jgi:ornithine cyclodeaminase/thiomorpholine-carboxylate dehydrogenase
MVPAFDVLILNRTEVEELLDLDALFDALADGFRALTRGEVSAPQRNQLPMPGSAFLLGMPGRTGDGLMTVKVVTLFEDNPSVGLPAHMATIALYDPTTGACRAFMDGTYITAIRTSAAAALACDRLAREDARALAIVGGGVQAEHHLAIFPRVRAFEDIRIVARDPQDARRLAAGHDAARVLEDAEEAVRGADVVALTTNSARPVIDVDWIAPGSHVSSVGYHPPQGELPRALAETAHLFVETRVAFEAPPVGSAELHGLDPEIATEIGEVLLGSAPGRREAEEITVYKAMGHVVEDIAAAELVFAAAQRAGAGASVSL